MGIREGCGDSSPEPLQTNNDNGGCLAGDGNDRMHIAGREALCYPLVARPCAWSGPNL